jgi:tyrosyl-tRNA synthetase
LNFREKGIRIVLTLEKQIAIMKRGAVEILPEAELVDKSKRSIESGEPLQ